MTAWLLAIIATVVPLLYYVYRTAGLLRLGLQVGMNDSSFASEIFLKLLKDAERTMLICDDGNSMTDSIYNRKDVAARVLDRLKANPRLQIVCLFFSNDDTVFTRMLDGHAQVTMKRGVRPRRDIHFKIIDDGRKGYVSSHPIGAAERRYRLYDCSRVPAFIRDAALGHHIRAMRAQFPDMEAAVA